MERRDDQKNQLNRRNSALQPRYSSGSEVGRVLVGRTGEGLDFTIERMLKSVGNG